MSVAKSFFDITTGRNHGVIPTSDAVRIVLDAGATLMLDRTDTGEIQASADWERAETPDNHLSRVSATGDRVDRALSALVEKLLTGESGVEVTEWTILPDALRTGDEHSPDESGGSLHKGVMFGRVWVPLFAIGDSTSEQVNDHIARLLIRDVEEARQNCNDRINAVIVRCDGKLAGVACLSERPDPPIGATLTGRRLVGGTPSAEVPWKQVTENRGAVMQRAIDVLRRDCELAGLDLPSYTPRLSVLFRDGRQSGQVELMTWGDTAPAPLAKIVKGMVMRAAGHDPVSLRLTALPRTK